MSFEFVFAVAALLAFTAYYFWFHANGFPRVPKVTWVSGSLSVGLFVWLLSAYLQPPVVEAVTYHKIEHLQRIDGTVEEVIRVEDETFNLKSLIGGSLPPDSQVKLTRFRKDVLWLQIHRKPIIDVIRSVSN